MSPLPFETPTQFAALVLTLIAGWLFGLASASGGRKWRERYEDEEFEHASYRNQAEADLKDANRKVRDLEAENARLRKDVDAGATTPVAAAVSADAEGGAGWRGWFGWGRDNLSRIRGIDRAREERLNELGIKTYREIEKMTADDEAALEQRLELTSGTIANEGWREQAALLRAGNEDEHGERFGEKKEEGSSVLPVAAAAAIGAAAVALATRDKEEEPAPAAELAAEPAAEAHPS